MTLPRRIAFSLAFVAALVAAPNTAQATFPGANGRIAFYVNDNPFIHTIRPDGSGDQRLAVGVDPSWSADGQHIVYTTGAASAGPIFTMRADGSQQRRLTNGLSAFSPGYAPNGRRIVFGRYTSDGNGALIASMRSDGTDQRVLARGNAIDPEYSPTGGRIAYSAPSPATGSIADVWVMRPDGSHKRQLTDSTARHPEGVPHYSPDGKHIIFGRGGGGRAPRVFVMRSDGSHVHRLGCRGVGAALYSPNGRKLAWTGAVGAYETDIFTSTVRCTDPFRVTYHGVPSTMIGAQSPSWQPLPGG